VIKRFAALVVLVSIVSVTIVHACSGLDSVRTASLHNASDDATMAGQPCDQMKHDDDLCKSIRYRMLSIQAESAPNSLTLLPSTLPSTISVEDVLPLAALRAAPPRAAAVDSIFRHSPRLSHIVLRI
jgi:hypothetical protein